MKRAKKLHFLVLSKKLLQVHMLNLRIDFFHGTQLQLKNFFIVIKLKEMSFFRVYVVLRTFTFLYLSHVFLKFH